MGRLEYCPLVGSGGCTKRDSEIIFQKNTFFLAEPFKPEKDRERREIVIGIAIKETLKENFSESSLIFADKEPTDLAIFCEICQKIQSCEFGIVELSGMNPNVLLEFGMMIAFGKPIFVIVKKKEEEEIKPKIPSDIIWKRAIPYEEFADLIKELKSPLEARQNLKFKPSIEKVDLKEPLDKNYKSIGKWFKEVGKKGLGGKNIDEQKQSLTYVISQYSQFVKMNPDEIIQDAENEKMRSGGAVKSHEDMLEKFLCSLKSQSSAHLYWSYIKGGFYGHNGIRLDIDRPKYKPKHSYDQLTTEQLRKISDVATLRSRSWILVDSYIGLDVGQLRLLKVEDFHIEKWTETRKIYPVTIRKEVSGTFEYTTFIGLDAKTALEEYFKTIPHSQQDLVWNMIRQTFQSEFDRERDRAGLGAKIESNRMEQVNGMPKNFATITTKAIGKRLKDTLEESIPLPNWNIVDYLLGRIREGVKMSTPLPEEIENAYSQILPKLIVYEGQIPPIIIRSSGRKPSSKKNKKTVQPALI
ncbi:MAG: hypothetical protein ABSB71_04990 [Candidatus Bathyarchaeia archaeon]|jgi:integrase